MRPLKGPIFTLKFQQDATISEIKKQIQGKKDILASHQCLIFAGKYLEDGQKLSEYNTGNNVILHLIPRVKGNMVIFVRTQIFGNMIALPVDPHYLIFEIKGILRIVAGIPVVRQCLTFDGKILEDDQLLSDYNIQRKSVLNLVDKTGK